ncbi:hypothetical protein QVN42_01780 [Yersinia nurmii]|uniref:Uncharacterized protein n=1 Tax=Yersinia nurmii TaxID=685706 RepID=A0AAW7JY86_9GAMM|nr:hypothetical protein [Yersinia nurmii]MDN0086132.1 hypothetical protein [Yersinia nurmii]
MKQADHDDPFSLRETQLLNIFNIGDSFVQDRMICSEDVLDLNPASNKRILAGSKNKSVLSCRVKLQTLKNITIYLIECNEDGFYFLNQRTALSENPVGINNKQEIKHSLCANGYFPTRKDKSDQRIL